MTTPPPRKFSSSTTLSKEDVSPLKILLQMGFTKKRALKALAATGNRNVQLASDWLLTHVNDKYVDVEEPREYVLYANPTGILLLQIHEFWEKSKAIGGWNGAHNFPPHITLVPFFKVDDQHSLSLAKAVKDVIDKVGYLSTCPLKLEPYISLNFMGLFLYDECADYFKKISTQYINEVSSESIQLEVPKKSFHITLAYHFDVSTYDVLKLLVDELVIPEETNWELRLYSRDPRFANHQVYKVTQGYLPKASDELELVIGDYIYIEQKEFDNSTDGWVRGTSWLTGISGYLPTIYTKRTAESDAWTLHRAISLGSDNCTTTSQSDINADGDMPNYPHEDAASLAREKSEETYKEWEKYWKEVHHDRSESILRVTQSTSIDMRSSTVVGIGDSEYSIESVDDSSSSEVQNTRRRWFFGMRHGERVDLTYGQWVPYCFDENDVYIRKDLNMPLKLAERVGGSDSYSKDTPLTRVGQLQARLVGEGLRLAGVTVQHVYASAALRCVETAHNFLEGLEADPSVKIKVEPGLFEYTQWYMPNGMAPFMTSRELHNAGYNVDLRYKPYVNLKPNTSETVEEWYKRNELVMHSVVKDTALDGGNIIFIGHAATLDLMVYALKRFDKKRSESENYEISKNLLRVPYCALGAMRDQPWQVVSPPCPPSINSSSGRFDWKILLDVQ